MHHHQGPLQLFLVDPYSALFARFSTTFCFSFDTQVGRFWHIFGTAVKVPSFRTVLVDIRFSTSARGFELFFERLGVC